MIQETAQRIYEEPEWRNLITASPDVLGIDSISQTTFMVRVLIRTKPGQQWRVQREFYRRVLTALSQHNIAIAAS
jgi:small conductance mechanosensitive channel